MLFHSPCCLPSLREREEIRELATSRVRCFTLQATALQYAKDDLIKEANNHLVTALPVASRQEVTKPTHIHPSLPCGFSPLPRRVPKDRPNLRPSRLPRGEPSTFPIKLYLCLSSQPGAMNVTVALRVESAAFFCPIPSAWQPRRHADRKAGYGSTGAFSANSLSIVLGGLVCS